MAEMAEVREELILSFVNEEQLTENYKLKLLTTNLSWKNATRILNII